jgi:hypothetical protein
MYRLELNIQAGINCMGWNKLNRLELNQIYVLEFNVWAGIKCKG